MRNSLSARSPVLAIAGSTPSTPSTGHWSYGHMRMNPEDRAALPDADRAVHVG